MRIKHLFIINPAAGVKNRVEEMVEEIKRAFILNTDRPDEKYSIVLTKEKGDGFRLAREALEAAKGTDEHVRLYACGGDGTLNEVVNGSIGYENFAICPVPIGSGNDFIKIFEDIPKERFLDISACVRGEEKPCDVMRVGDQYSINIISVGLDAVTGKKQHVFKRLPGVSGPLAYDFALGYAFLYAMKNKMRFEIDDEPFDVDGDAVTLAVAGNGRWYGGGFKAAPFADISDGKIDFIAISAISRLTFFKCVGKYKKGQHIGAFDFVKYKKCEKIKIFSDKPVTIQFDGEVFDMKDPEIAIVPAAIRIILPAEK